MPPAAALECDRTGWTLLMIATVAPALAAARAARCPASPAPMMRTSCAGMAEKLIWRQAALRRGSAGVDAVAPCRVSGGRRRDDHGLGVLEGADVESRDALGAGLPA